MANILLVDPAEVARKALKGILARGSHRLVSVATAQEAWDFVRRNIKVDLVFLEMQLEGDSGLALIQRLRSDAFLKLLPVVVYTSTGNRETVRLALELKVQNFLMKPYHDEKIFAEIEKEAENPWRNLHFEEEKSFCKMMGLTSDELHKMLENLRSELGLAAPLVAQAAQKDDFQGVVERLDELTARAEAAGAWGLVECIANLRAKAESSAWVELIESAPIFDFASRLILYHLNPGMMPTDYLSDDESQVKEEARARALWFDAPVENRCPVVNWPQLEKQLDGLAGCPVIDSVAASFQMSATGHPSSLVPLMDQSERDPGLATQLLIAANQVRHHEDGDTDPLDNPRMCIGMLGELRLASVASGLVTSEERKMNLPPCTWSNYWMFQIGVARMARYTCGYLELYNLETRAYTAGLLHDLGRLLLFNLHPKGFAAILAYAGDHVLPIGVVEKRFLDCTTQDMGVHFATKRGLPKSYCNVMRWATNPAEATEDAELVAIVSLARDLCLQNQVGFSGETPKRHQRDLSETPEWRILSQSVFPSFDLKKFEALAHAECRDLRQELHGHRSLARV